MRKLLLAVALVVTLVFIESAIAQIYPSRPITVVVGFSAGGPTDVLARLLAERMRVSLGQIVIVENVTGVSGTVGVGRVARAAPDGYTLSIGDLSTHVVNGAIYPLPYDLLKDLEPVALLPSNPQLIVARNTVPAKDLKELVAWLKANPDRSFGTAGVGSPPHVSGIYFENSTGAHLQFVPYRGGGPALQDLLAGQIDLMINQAIFALPQVREGRIRAYAVTAKTRMPSAPDIPTVDEAGLPGFYVSIWRGLWVPKGTPKDVIAKLNAAVVDALADPAVRQRLADLGQELPPREQQTPEALGAFHKAEIEKWWQIGRASCRERV